MKKTTKIKKTLALALALCLVMAYFPLQASAEDNQPPANPTITSQDDWNAMDYTTGNWPETINITGNIDTDRYVYSNITVTSGTFTTSAGISGAVTVSGGTFNYQGQGNPLSSVTLTDGAFTNGGTVSAAIVEGGTFTNDGTVTGLTLSGTGAFVNEGTVSGTVNVDGGTFTNAAGGTVESPVLMSDGDFNNNGTIRTLELSGGKFTISGSSSQDAVTMSGGTITNNEGTEVSLNINGQVYSLAGNSSFKDVLAAPANLTWTQNSDKRNVTATWGSVADAESYNVTLYKGNQKVGDTQTVSDTICDFTSQILAGGHGTYTFRVQALANGQVASPAVTSEIVGTQGVFEYSGPSGDVTTNDYAWNAATQTLSIRTNNGCPAWKSNTSILGTLIDDSSFDIVKHAVLGPKVSILMTGILPCPQLETLVVQAGGNLTAHSRWASGIPSTVKAYHPGGVIPGFNYHVEKFECLIAGIEDGQVFKGSAPDGFTVYGAGNVVNQDARYMQAQSWEITKSGGGRVSGGNFTENEENAYTVGSADMKLNPADYGTYTLAVTYQPQEYTDGSWADDGGLKTVSATFTIEPEGGTGGDPDPSYPSVRQYTIISSADPGGTITPDGSTVVSAGLSASYAVKAAEGYILKDVLVDGNSVGPLAEYTFERVYADHTIHAVFEKKAGGDDPLEPDNPEKPGKPNKPGTPADKPNGRPGTSGKPGSGTVSTGSGTTDNTPKTGDESDLLLWIVLAAAAGGTTLVLARRRSN